MVYSSLVELNWRPKAAAKFSQIAVGRYIYGMVESMYISIELDINVVVDVDVETPVGMHVMDRTSAMNRRATSWYIGNVTFFEPNLEAS